MVLTGNVQSHWAAEVRERFHDANSPTVATELVTTSITCGGDGCETSPEIADLLRENPHIRFSKNRRGYVRCVITPEQLRADFRVLPYVSRPDAPVQTAASFVVVDREPALQRVV